VPKVGAIVCWGSATVGHVAVIEKLIYNENGKVAKIGMSWSGYYHVKDQNGNDCCSCLDFKYDEVGCSADGKPTGGSNHPFQGYIYLPIEQSANAPRQDYELENNFTTSTFVSTSTRVRIYLKRGSSAKFKPVNAFIISEQNKS
jgi:hypothetical protein